MPAPAPRRWLVAAVVLAGLVAAALWLKESQGARSERATRSPTEPLVLVTPATQEEPPTLPEGGLTPDPAAEKEWRLEVEIRDETGVAISGRVYVTDSKGDLLDAFDTEPPARLVRSVRGTVSLIAYVSHYVPQFFGNQEPPASGIRSLVVRVDRGAGISGKVVDESGEPVRARIWAWPIDPPPWLIRKAESWKMYADGREQWFGFRSSTEGDGSFRVDGLPPGPYEIECGLSQTRREGKPALLNPERIVAAVGDSNVRIVCRRAVEVHVRFVDANTGDELPTEALATWEAADVDGDWWNGGSGPAGAGPIEYDLAPGASFTFSAEVEGYISPEPVLIKARDKPGTQDVPIRFQIDAGAMAELELVVRDDAGAPPATLMVGHGKHCLRRYSEDGRFLLRIPAGHQRIGLDSPGDEVLRFKREWIVSVDERDEQRPAHVYVHQDIDLDLPRGGRVTREVTIQRAALIWVRQEPRLYDVHLVQGDAQVKDAFDVLPMSMGLVAAVEPGSYTVEGRAGEAVVRVEVAAEAAKVAEVWLRAAK